MTGKAGDVRRHNGLHDEDDDLYQGGADEHIADDGDLPKSGLSGFLCFFFRRFGNRRFLDEKEKDQKVEEQGDSGKVERHAHTKKLC